jgi:peptidoglycan DL-endopeptidase CwlO
LRTPLLPCLAMVVVVLAAAVPASGTNPIDEKRAEARQVYAQIIQLDQDLSAADEKINLADLRLAQVQADQKVNRHELVVAKQNLDRSQKLIAQRLVSMWASPHPSTLDMILGATSVSDLMTRIDDADRLSSVDSQVIGQVKTFKAAVVRHGRLLANEHVYADHLLAQRRAERASIAAQETQRRDLLGSIQGEIATLVAQEQARELQAARARAAAAAAAQQQQQAEQEQAQQQTVVGASAATPEGATVTATSPYGSQVVSIAMSYLGVPYVWGGASPGGFDCSGLVMYSFAQLGISLPHSSYAQWNYGQPVSETDLQPGDLVFFDDLGHVGLYIGGGEYVDAPYTGAVVRVDSLSDPWAESHYSGARRIV